MRIEQGTPTHLLAWGAGELPPISMSGFFVEPPVAWAFVREQLARGSRGFFMMRLSEVRPFRIKIAGTGADKS